MLYDIILTLNGVARQVGRNPSENPPEWESFIVIIIYCVFGFIIFFVFGHGWHGVYNRAGRVGTRSDLIWEVF